MITICAVVEVNPGDLGVNGARRAVVRNGKPSTRKTPRYMAARATVAIAVRRAAEGTRLPSGPVAVTLTFYWPSRRRRGPAEGLPYGDIDGPEVGVLNAITDSGVWGDDAQVVEKITRNRCDHARPRVEIAISDEVLRWS